MTVEMLPKDQRPLEKRASNLPALTTQRFSIFDILPVPAILYLAKPYLAGPTPESALQKGHQIFESDHFCGTLDVLGEDAASDDDCELYVEKYKSLIDLVADNPLKTPFDREKLTISMKPSMFCDVVPTAQAARAKMDKGFERIARVVDYGMKKKIRMTLEAEDWRWANFHLDAYFALLNAGYTNLGTVLQTRLFRSKNDLKRFDENSRVRLVIGIYQESPDIAFVDKRDMKDLLLDFSKELFARGTYVELATHDADYIRKFASEVVIPQKVSPQQFETQFLLGVPRYKLQKALVNGDFFKDPEFASPHAEALSRAGCLVRMYLPFGNDKVSGPYCKRRLIHNPNMITYGIKNLLGIQS
jgi:proline dehydrogenase